MERGVVSLKPFGTLFLILDHLAQHEYMERCLFLLLLYRPCYMLMGDLSFLNRNERGVNWVMRTERAYGRRTGRRVERGNVGQNAKLIN